MSNVAVHDLEPEDFPIALYVHTNPRSVGASWVWAVTVLRPPAGERVALHIPGFAEYGPVWVTSTFAGGTCPAISGPYPPADLGA